MNYNISNQEELLILLEKIKKDRELSKNNALEAAKTAEIVKKIKPKMSNILKEITK